MTSHREIKLAVLRGVYEDNLGIPRTAAGTRRPRSAPPPPPPPTRFGRRARAAILALFGITVLFGINFRLVSVDSSGPVAMQFTSEQAARPVDTETPAASNPDHSLLWDAGLPAGIEDSLGIETTAEQYGAMIDRLGLPMAELFGLKVQTIVIDPGHGGIDPGAIGHQGLKEKDVALDIAVRLREKLTESGKFRVLLTREEDRKVYLKERVAFAKDNHADLFVSIHVNSLAVKSVNYVETYYFGPHRDQRSLDLAAKENRDSDYVMGEFHEIIARIGNTLKIEESKALALSIHRHLYDNLKRLNAGLVDAGTKTGPFMVLLGVEVPSVLVEVSCISNRGEEARLGTPEYRDGIADFLEAGIVEYLYRREYQRTIARGT
jgi:N-acetylmuramoyl-L-alanine amidase